MKRLLLVDDDAVLMRAYRDRLSAHGFQVNTAASGTAAMTILRSAKPDLVVLDLMMPDLSGVEVLKFIRSESRLAATPVVVLTNAYLNDLGRQATALGTQKTLLKAQCNPSALMACIDELLQAKPAAARPAQAPAPPPVPPNAPPPRPAPKEPPAGGEIPFPARPAHVPTPFGQSARAEAPAQDLAEKGEPRLKASTDLLAHAPTICADLRKLFQAAVQKPRNDPEQLARLRELYRRVHFLASAAGMTQYAQLAQTSTVFEALLYVLINDPRLISSSVMRTLASLVDFVERLFRHGGQSLPGASLSVPVLVVDDDPVSNRLVVSALRQAQFNPRSTEDPLVAWEWANREHFDLFLLDVEMPVFNGFELCKRLRTLPGYKKTPIIFVTIHTDFESRAQGSLSGGDDLIAKPILPMELAAKAVMQLLKRQLPV